MTTTPTQQPDALRLADAWDAAISTRRHVSIGCEMADELRRLHTEIERLMNEAKQERSARQAAQLRIEELQAQLVRADAERCMAVSNAMRRIQAREKLTYTDKEVELIMLGWQAEFDKAKAARIEAQTEKEALKAKLAKSGLEKWRAVREAVAAEREACEERVEDLYEKIETPYLVDIARAIHACDKA